MFFFKDTATTEIYPLSLHDALPISLGGLLVVGQYLLFLLGREVGEKPEPLALLHHVRGVLVDLTPYGQGLLEQDLHRLLVLLEPLGVAEEHLVACSGLRQGQDVELSWRLAHHVVLVWNVEHGGLYVSAQKRRRAYLRAGHVADLAELDALDLLDEHGLRLGARAPRVHGEGLAVESLPVGVGGLVDYGEVPQGLKLAEDPYGSRGAFDQAVRRTEPHVGLPADDGLVREVLVGQLVGLDLHAALANVLQGDEQGDRKGTRLNSSHANISYAVFCLKKKTLTLCLQPSSSPHLI